MGILGRYKNGNYNVTLFEDGTKIRMNNLDSLTPSFAESMDCKITNQCDAGCLWCHENSVPEGKHGDILNPKFLNSLKPYTEIAIGGGNPLDHPKLIEFLAELRERKIIPNITVNQVHLKRYPDYVKFLIHKKYIYGLGVSVEKLDEDFVGLLNWLNSENIVLHVINGIVDIPTLETIKNFGLKVLALGYKNLRRGADYLSPEVGENGDKTMEYLKNNMQDFKFISFDNLALEQLRVREIVGEQVWKDSYMGDDGEYTMYVDLVKDEFAESSTSKDRFKNSDVEWDTEKMFKKVVDSKND